LAYCNYFTEKQELIKNKKEDNLSKNIFSNLLLWHICLYYFILFILSLIKEIIILNKEFHI